MFPLFFLTNHTSTSVNKGVGKVKEGVGECVAKSNFFEGGREMVYRLVKIVSKRKVREGGRKVVNRLVEKEAERELGKGVGKVVHWEVKIVAESEGDERRR